ncbi:protein LAZY 1-like isoform X1 [Zingiber officinale]|uniref:protein LAZY 1-like isoform X1 n=1 Tax=Zingiber officinale TaxID=94328 RepID=UPI001C4CB4B1|nr:protein LAZY 1-like isoform X1 [Zingiber officinale]
MKLLGWMHRKFRQNGGEELKDSGGAAVAGCGGSIFGLTDVRSSTCVAGGTCNRHSGRPSLDLDLNRRRFHYDPLKARSLRLHVEALDDCGGGGGGGGGEDPIAEEFFEGLLTIGTLGVGTGPIEEKREEEEMEELAVTEQVDGKPLQVAVVAIPAALEAIAEKEAEATTETDLIMVSEELEKVLTAEEEKAGGRMSSARSSHAGAAACPLQGFLFGLPVEAAETVLMEAEAAGGSRKERRASLGELFMMSRITEEGEAKFAGGDDGEGKLTAPEMCLTKKKPTKQRGRKGSPVDGANAFNGSTMEKKFQKILQLFHKKVHPESSIMSKKPSKTARKTEKISTSKATIRKENSSISNFSNAPSSASSGKNNRGHWIKTDAEYLVLEL